MEWDVGDAGVDTMESSLCAAFMSHRARLTSFISARCGDENVGDLVQELWLKAEAVRMPVEKPLHYLYRIADRLVLDSRRGASRSRSRDNDWAFTQGRLSEAVEPPLAERRLLALERLNRIEARLAAVGQRAALVFRRYRLDGVDQRTIAQELGISLSTVEKDLRKIYDALLALEEREYEE
jgi:RNA polymerase sigma factor (sigma-70 family)